MPDGTYGLDYMYANTTPDQLQTELDTCWVNVGGENPAEYVKKYTGRAPVVHLKDFEGSKSEQMYELIGIKQEKKEVENTFRFRPVGHGKQNFPAILEAAVEAGASWVVVEQDQWYDTPALECAKMSREYLKSLGW
jgi:sugar phosphate isomerase/epimerase